MDDEHSLLHMPKHREGDHSCAAQGPSVAVQQYLSFFSHQNCGRSSAWFTGHHLG